MVQRQLSRGLLGIAQPAHAWLSGELARAWGRAPLAPPEPMQETAYAAEQHDVGWLEWERHPQWNPSTGYPHSFLNMPAGPHLETWRRGVAEVQEISQYAALLVSLHSEGVYLRAGTEAKRTAEDARKVEEFLAERRRFHHETARALADDPRYAAHCSPEARERARSLLFAWDALSLHLCIGSEQEASIENVAASTGRQTLRLSKLSSKDGYSVDPWPFIPDAIEVTVEARLMEAPCGSQEELDNYWPNAPKQRLSLTLQPV
jgi:hypothetical protein